MLTTNRIRRSAAASALTCAALMSAGTGVAVAGIPAEQYYSSYATPAGERALQEEQYFSSYGSPEPIAAPQATGGTGDDTAWLEITLSAAGALALAGVGVTQARRVRIRRRHVAEAGL